jgi:hypothetical protein
LSPIVRKDAVNRDPYLGSAARRHEAGALLELMKTSQMGFGVGEKHSS